MCNLDCCLLYCTLISAVGVLFLLLILILTMLETPFFPLRLESGDSAKDTALAIGITMAVYAAFFLCSCIWYTVRSKQNVQIDEYLKAKEKMKKQEQLELS